MTSAKHIRKFDIEQHTLIWCCLDLRSWQDHCKISGWFNNGHFWWSYSKNWAVDLISNTIRYIVTWAIDVKYGYPKEIQWCFCVWGSIYLNQMLTLVLHLSCRNVDRNDLWWIFWSHIIWWKRLQIGLYRLLAGIVFVMGIGTFIVCYLSCRYNIRIC